MINKKKFYFYSFRFILILLAVLAALKTLILGMSVDEEYAITMSYRMVSGDRMFMEMWEPHQTSGFLSALLTGLFLQLTGSTAYLGLFLRAAGLLIQGAVSFFVYDTLKRDFRESAAFYAGLASFVISPKWIRIPEFSNLLLWCSLCSAMCLIRFAKGTARAHGWLIPAALFYCGCILAYPTCLLVLPVLMPGILAFSGTKRWKNLSFFLGTCVLTGLGYLAYFLSHMSFSALLGGLSQMMTDGEHSESLSDRLLVYVGELRSWMIPLLIILVISLLFIKKRRFLPVLMLTAILEQGYFWFFTEGYVHRPYLFYYVLFLAGFFCLDKKSALFRLCFLPSAAMWLSALLLTNTGLRVTGVYLFPGVLASCISVFSAGETDSHTCTFSSGELASGETVHSSRIPVTRGLLKAIPSMILPAFALLLLIAKGLIVYGPEGSKMDALYVKQKALSGPAKNIYCRYTDGYDYNNAAELLSEYVTEADCLLSVGQHSLYYMLADCTIGTYSTISTPTYDERLLTYWKEYPDHYPTKVLIEENSPYEEDIKKYLLFGPVIAQKEGMILYAVEK